MFTPISAEVLELLGRASTATLTTQLFKLGFRNTFLAGLVPLRTDGSRLIGEAFTLRYRPAREDLDVLPAFSDYDHPQRKAIESVGPGEVLIMNCRGDGRAASVGAILATRLLRRGAAGLVTDGSVRDSAEIANLSIPVFTGGISPTTNFAPHHAVEMQVPIGCAGVPVYPGDVLVGDGDGVVCVPRESAAVIAQTAVDRDVLEEFMLAKVNAGAPLRGTLPPDDATLAEFRSAVSK